jgi:hypothetical protein
MFCTCQNWVFAIKIYSREDRKWFTSSEICRVISSVCCCLTSLKNIDLFRFTSPFSRGCITFTVEKMLSKLRIGTVVPHFHCNCKILCRILVCFRIPRLFLSAFIHFIVNRLYSPFHLRVSYSLVIYISSADSNLPECCIITRSSFWELSWWSYW